MVIYYNIWLAWSSCHCWDKSGIVRAANRVHILVEMKQGQCICPLSWSVHCNFTGEGKCKKRGWPCTPPPPYQPGLILPSPLNVRQKAAVATLCTLWCGQCRPNSTQFSPQNVPSLPFVSLPFLKIKICQQGRGGGGEVRKLNSRPYILSKTDTFIKAHSRCLSAIVMQQKILPTLCQFRK
jgi:hypothetical protein